jgi:hypothetical protein
VQNLRELKDNKMAVNLIIASMFRLVCLYNMRYFYPLYYQAAFADQYEQFSEYNALFLTFLGFIASLGAGYLSDQLNRDDPEDSPDVKLLVG